MAHLLILCEGETEHRILKPFLSPYWQQKFTSVEVQHYAGNGELKTNFKADAEQQLTEEPKSHVLCLVDMYREPFNLYQSANMSIDTGYQLIRAHMYNQINSRFHPRFGAFPVVMEIETWLLADPTVQSHIGQSISHPETIDHPSGLLEAAYKAKRKQYGKINDGVDLFGRANAQRVYDDNCPYFNQIADWLVKPPSIITEIASEGLVQKMREWEEQRDAKYKRFLALNRAEETTDEALDAATEAYEDFKDFLLTHGSIFRQN